MFTHALLPDFGPTLFELFPYDLLARTPMLMNPLYVELMDASGLLIFVPALGARPQEFRRFGYRFGRPPGLVIDDSPLALLPAEIQQEILKRVLKQLEPLPGQEAQFLRARVEFLHKKSLYTKYRLQERTPYPDANFLDEVPEYLRPLIRQGLHPSGGIEAEIAWNDFWVKQVRPFLPMNDKAYLALLDRFVTLVPLTHESKQDR